MNTIRTIRDACSLTRKAMGGKLGVTEHSIKRLETGRLKMSHKMALVVFAVFGPMPTHRPYVNQDLVDWKKLLEKTP